MPVFDVDFFNPMNDDIKTEVVSPESIKLEEVDIMGKYKTTESESEGKKYAEFNFAGKDFKVDISSANESVLGPHITDLIGQEVQKYIQENGEKVRRLRS